jgi:hypothetical protein
VAEQIEAEERRSKSSKGGVDRSQGGADLDRREADQAEKNKSFQAEESRSDEENRSFRAEESRSV